MKVLFISQTFPYPPDTGSRNIIYRWLQAVSSEHFVDLLVVGHSPGSNGKIEGLPNVTVTTLGTAPKRTLLPSAIRLSLSILTGIPAASLIGMSSPARTRAIQIRQARLYEAIILSENAAAGYAILLQEAAPVILLKHSLHAVDARAERQRHGTFHLRSLLEERIVRRFEAKTCRAATVICTVTAEDAKELAQRYHLANPPEVIPIGVDSRLFPARDSDPGGRVVGFFGNLAWGANVDAVLWFAKRVLPRIWQVYPDVVFRVVGPGGEGLRHALRDPRLVFSGRVPSIPDALKDVAVGVVPVVSGTGIRFKLLELLSMGVPTVTTPLGKVGTECLHQTHALVAEDPESFAQAVVTLLSSPALRQELAREATKLAAAYSWEKIFERIRNLVNGTIHQWRHATLS